MSIITINILLLPIINILVLLRLPPFWRVKGYGLTRNPNPVLVPPPRIFLVIPAYDSYQYYEYISTTISTPFLTG